MVDVKDYLASAAIIFCMFCTGYSLIILPIMSISPEFQTQIALCSPFLISILYWFVALLILGYLIIDENITIWHEMKKEWKKKRSPLTRIREDEPTTCGFERHMTQLNHKTTEEMKNK